MPRHPPHFCSALYISSCLRQRRLKVGLLLVLVGAPTLSTGLNLFRMVRGYQLNAEAVKAQTPESTETEVADLPSSASPWHLLKTLFLWRAGSGEQESFSESAWLARHGEFALTNFTTPVLILLTLYLLYWLVGQGCLTISRAWSPSTPPESGELPHAFEHMWFFLWPGALFLFTFEGLIWEHQFWQSPLTPFIAIACAQGIFLLKHVASCLGRWLGQAVFVGLLLVVVVSCNRGLVAYRAVRWQSPYTLDLFKRLKREIPPDKALLTFKDFMIQQNEAKAAFYRPEYAWYLDREMIVANAWPSDPNAVPTVRASDVVSDTVREIQRQAVTGRFPFYFVPDVRKPNQAETGPSFYRKLFFKSSRQPPDEWAGLSNLEVHRRLNDFDWSDDARLYQEKAFRYHSLLIKKLKKLYAHEYVHNPSFADDRDYCHWGNTPCYLFDLNRPLE